MLISTTGQQTLTDFNNKSSNVELNIMLSIPMSVRFYSCKFMFLHIYFQ